MPEQHSTKYQQWLARGNEYSRRTPRGTVMCLKINVNRSGNGFMFNMTDKGKVDQVLYPVMNIEEAVDALRDLWEQAVAKANEETLEDNVTDSDDSAPTS